jgi:hypothetical protein
LIRWDNPDIYSYQTSFTENRKLKTGFYFFSSSFSASLMKGFTKSMGMGNRVVEFFSAAISRRVWR